MNTGTAVMADSRNHREHGHFFGRTVTCRSLNDLTVSEVVYAPGVTIPRHDHALASICFVLSGFYDERYGYRDRACTPGMVILHPEGEHHADAHRDSPVRLLSVEIGVARLASWRQAAGALGEPADFEGGRMGRLAARLASEFRASDTASDLAIEALVLEMVAESCRVAGRSDERSPPWLADAEAFLRLHFNGAISLDDVAQAAGVHPAHLARVFRRRHHKSIGAYLRELRLEAACRSLSTSGLSLAEIAADAGFADQSHFSRLLRRATGLSPAAYRRMHRRDH